LYTSSPAGHLILSHLKDSTYTVTIGFPGQVSPEQRFVFNIHQKDQAFSLKDWDGKGWGLYDEQGQQLKRTAEERSSEKPLFTGVKKDDPFSRLMAAVVRDTAVMYNTYALGQTLTDSSVALTHPLSDSTHRNPSQTASFAPTTPAQTTPFPTLPSATTSTSPIVFSPIPASPAASATLSPSATQTSSPKTKDSSAASPLPKDTLLSPSPSSHADPGRMTSLSPLPDSLVSVPSSVSASGSARQDSANLVLRPDSPPRLSSSAHPDSSAVTQPYHPSAVVKLSERKSSRALRLVYADHPTDKKADTIVVIIPIDSAAPSSAIQVSSSHTLAIPTVPIRTTPASGNQASLASATPAIPASPTGGSPIRTEHLHPLAPSSDTPHLTAPGSHGPNLDSPALSSATVSHPKPVLPFVNSDCHAYATDYDVDKLRVKMLEVAKDDDRIQTARKFFKTKCFSTRQIKALSEVFTIDASKFKFLEAAYPFVSDDHFSELVSLFADPAYSGRFRAMTDRN